MIGDMHLRTQNCAVAKIYFYEKYIPDKNIIILLKKPMFHSLDREVGKRIAILMGKENFLC